MKNGAFGFPPTYANCEEGLTSNTVISKKVISNLENGYLKYNLETRALRSIKIVPL